MKARNRNENPSFAPANSAGQGAGADLRDVFAGQALIATLSHEENMVCLAGNQAADIESMADDCYKMADAMLAARLK